MQVDDSTIPDDEENNGGATSEAGGSSGGVGEDVHVDPNDYADPSTGNDSGGDGGPGAPVLAVRLTPAQHIDAMRDEYGALQEQIEQRTEARSAIRGARNDAYYAHEHATEAYRPAWDRIQKAQKLRDEAQTKLDGIHSSAPGFLAAIFLRVFFGFSQKKEVSRQKGVLDATVAELRRVVDAESAKVTAHVETKKHLDKVSALYDALPPESETKEMETKAMNMRWRAVDIQAHLKDSQEMMTREEAFEKSASLAKVARAIERAEEDRLEAAAALARQNSPQRSRGMSM